MGTYSSDKLAFPLTWNSPEEVDFLIKVVVEKSIVDIELVKDQFLAAETASTQRTVTSLATGAKFVMYYLIPRLAFQRPWLHVNGNSIQLVIL